MWARGQARGPGRGAARPWWRGERARVPPWRRPYGGGARRAAIGAEPAPRRRVLVRNFWNLVPVSRRHRPGPPATAGDSRPPGTPPVDGATCLILRDRNQVRPRSRTGWRHPGDVPGATARLGDFSVGFVERRRQSVVAGAMPMERPPARQSGDGDARHRPPGASSRRHPGVGVTCALAARSEARSRAPATTVFAPASRAVERLRPATGHGAGAGRRLRRVPNACRAGFRSRDFGRPNLERGIRYRLAFLRPRLRDGSWARSRPPHLRMWIAGSS